MESIVLAKLYSITKLNKIKEWEISVIPGNAESIIRAISGFVDGKKTTYDTTITKGKNVGKANETNHYTQALHEAKSKWNKKMDQGYSEDSNPLPAKNTGKQTEILPMLALDYTKRAHDIVFPCFGQPKLDGVRAITYGGSIYSRKGKEFTILDAITAELKEHRKLHLDGELFSKDLTFQEISGLVRKQKISTTDLAKLDKIKFVVYDLVSNDDYSVRLETLKKLFKENKFKYISLHTTEIVKTPEEVEYFHDKFVSNGDEGLILRNFLGPYEQKNRSKNLQKFKKFMDAEFEVSGFTEGEGIEKGLVLWICKVPGTESTFTVRPKGTHTERKKLYKNAAKYIGKELTVQFFEMTDDGIPRFPVGISFRDYE
jgi:ATP-dependent DNA ligase